MAETFSNDVTEITDRWVEEIDRLRAENKELKNAMRIADQRLITAAEKEGILYVGCDTPDALADRILEPMEHTKTPFTLQTDGKGFFWIDKLDDDGGFSICNMGDYENVLADGLFIVKACNCHDELLEACKAFVQHHNGYNIDGTSRGYGEDNARCAQNYERVFIMVEAAIAKVEN